MDEYIFVVGDVIGKLDLIFVVIVVGWCLLECLFNGKKDFYFDYNFVLIVVFMYLLIVMIGLIEEEVLEKYGENDLKVYCLCFILMYFVLNEYC